MSSPFLVLTKITIWLFAIKKKHILSKIIAKTRKYSYILKFKNNSWRNNLRNNLTVYRDLIYYLCQIILIPTAKIYTGI